VFCFDSYVYNCDLHSFPTRRSSDLNLKYDILVLKKYDICVHGTLYDTMLAHYLLEPDSRHNMDVMAENYLNYSPVTIATLIGKRSEEHTSELQSRENLVCRLLLEKK